MTSIFDENWKGIFHRTVNEVDHDVSYPSQNKEDHGGLQCPSACFRLTRQEKRSLIKRYRSLLKSRALSPRKRSWNFRYLKKEQHKFRSTLGVDFLLEGEFVDVIGTLSGKGFSRCCLRHGFAGIGFKNHGQHQ